MSERGVFAVDRGIWSDADFADEQFSEREAFLWMLSEAAWRPTKVRIGAHVVDLARGQLAFSTRFMAAKWKWSEARVRRYLGRLISAEIICTTTDKIATHVTILKYDRFQRVSLPDADVPTHTRRTDDAPSTHLRRKEEDREITESREVTSLRSVTAAKPRRHEWPDDYRDVAWARYGKKVDKLPSMAALDALHRADRTSWTEFIGGVDRQAEAVEAPYRPSMERFIKRQKWTDEYPQKEQRNGSGPNDLFAGRSASGRSAGTVHDNVSAAMARQADKRGLRSGGGQNDSRSEDRENHRPRRYDAEIEDADWTPADRYHAAH